ncbi:MAG TPA: hypothetical protein VKU60_06815 [Chloroflexota bacterium]|nr:hypothetical protein [Chloroflexota bacterium]
MKRLAVGVAVGGANPHADAASVAVQFGVDVGAGGRTVAVDAGAAAVGEDGAAVGDSVGWGGVEVWLGLAVAVAG